jgi:predicted metal-dependent hydrolase
VSRELSEEPPANGCSTWHLLLATLTAADYVAVHEMAHLQEPSHDTAFWDLVGRHGPGY